MAHHDYESLDIGVLGEDEKIQFGHAMLLIREHLRQPMKSLPIPDDVLEQAKNRFRDLARQMGAKDVRFTMSDDGKRLEVTFLDLPPMRALSYEIRLDDLPDASEP